MILEMIDKAIAHCKACRPNETGHGVTLSFLYFIRENVESKEYELTKAKEEIDRLKKEMIEEVEKAVDFYEVSDLKMPKWAERELYMKKLKEKHGIV